MGTSTTNQRPASDPRRAKRERSRARAIARSYSGGRYTGGITDRVDATLAARLHERANAGRWGVTVEQFRAVLAESVQKGAGAGDPSPREVERYVTALHLEDLALACACAAGSEGAWEHFIRTIRPVLYRAADALDRSGGVREIADSLYADLYGLQERDGTRRSLFRYFHGRSSLATWLRAVLAQRHIDRIRAEKRVEPLPEDEVNDHTAVLSPNPPDPDRGRLNEAIRRAFGRALGALAPKDRLRLSCYYARQLTLAETGRLLQEHEATVSRQLSKTRRRIRQDVERQLQQQGMSRAEIEQAFQSIVEDAGPLDLSDLLGKKSGLSRSVTEEVP